MDTEDFKYVGNTKYIGVTFSHEKMDDNDMLLQLQLVYEMLNRMFHECSIDVKIVLFRSYCTCSIANSFESSLLFYQRTFNLPLRSSLSTMYVINDIDKLETLITKHTFRFIERLMSSSNSIIECSTNSWIVTFQIIK